MKHSKNFEKKENYEGPQFLISNYITSPVIKTVWYWNKESHIGQWNRIESPEINPFPNDPLIFNRGNKHTQWAKDSLFNEWYWENWTDTCRKNETRPPSYATHKIKFRMD